MQISTSAGKYTSQCVFFSAEQLAEDFPDYFSFEYADESQTEKISIDATEYKRLKEIEELHSKRLNKLKRVFESIKKKNDLLH